MGIVAWAEIHGFQLLQSLGIVGGLLFTAFNFHADSKAREVQNLLAVTAAHREIWSNIYEHPHLARILNPSAEINSMGTEEERFVQMLILHLRSSFKARQSGMYFQNEGLKRDIKDFFSLPFPKAVWEKSKKYQDRDFVKFVDATI